MAGHVRADASPHVPPERRSAAGAGPRSPGRPYAGDVQVLVAPDKFKGTATATEAADAIGGGLEALGVSVVRQPLADG
ncbi:MAG: glycerate kinase, partial [Microthrixaceae bacterium]